MLRRGPPRKAKEGPPAKIPKEEDEEDEKDVSPLSEDVKDVKPLTTATTKATASVLVTGEIKAEQLLPRVVYECEYCSFKAMSDDKLTQHREKKHQIFLCRFCKTEFPSRHTQHSHYPFCDNLLAMRRKVRAKCELMQDRSHQHESIKSMHTTVKCPICKDTFRNMFDLGDRSKHPCKAYAVRLFACSGCKNNFTTANGLKSHLISKYNEGDEKCFDKAEISYEASKIPKFQRRGVHVNDDSDNDVPYTAVTLQTLPIKNDPTLPEEMHDDRMKHTLVTSHLLSDHSKSTTNTSTIQYYHAMRKMFYRVDCPYCGVTCRTHAGLHAHGINHHPPQERCLYQCAGCKATYQTPTGLGQHLKREFDNSNATCYNTVNLVRKQDYLGPVTGWNKKTKNPFPTKRVRDDSDPFMTIDVELDPNFMLDDVVVKQEDNDFVKKEEPEEDWSVPGPSSSLPPSLFSALAPVMKASLHGHPSYLAGDGEVKEEPLE